MGGPGKVLTLYEFNKDAASVSLAFVGRKNVGRCIVVPERTQKHLLPNDREI